MSSPEGSPPPDRERLVAAGRYDLDALMLIHEDLDTSPPAALISTETIEAGVEEEAVEWLGRRERAAPAAGTTATETTARVEPAHDEPEKAPWYAGQSSAKDAVFAPPEADLGWVPHDGPEEAEPTLGDGTETWDVPDTEAGPSSDETAPSD